MEVGQDVESPQLASQELGLRYGLSRQSQCDLGSLGSTTSCFRLVTCPVDPVSGLSEARAWRCRIARFGNQRLLFLCLALESSAAREGQIFWFRNQ